MACQALLAPFSLSPRRSTEHGGEPGIGSELCPVALEDTVPEGSGPAGFGGGARGSGGVWQHDQPGQQRGSLIDLPAPQRFLPSCCVTGKVIPAPLTHREPAGRAVFPPQRKDSAGPSRPSFSPQSLLSPSSSPRQQGGRGAGDRLPAAAQATPPRAKGKGCQVPVPSEQVLVDCAQALCQNESQRGCRWGGSLSREPWEKEGG